MATTVEIEAVTHQINVPNVVPEPPKTSSMRQNKWLVLIGVEFYMDGNARLGQCKSLEGPIRDIESVREFFADKIGIDNDHILTLKSTNPERASVDTAVNSVPKNEPMERDRSEWPTYENILKVLDKVTTSAERGDLVYVYYSGHGGRARTTFPQQKGARGVDETLVPLDINCGGRYVRDFEIAALIHKMIQQKDLHITLIFDSCHSGGATKDQKPHGMVARGPSHLDVQVLPTDTSDLSEEDLIAACQAGAMDPSTSENSFWLQPKGYVLLAACLPSQVAWEVDFSQVRRGVFTHWLVDSLRGAAAENLLAKLTHEALHRRVFANVADWAKKRGEDDSLRQDPVIMGSGNRLFTSSTISTAVASVPVLAVHPKEVRLGAGSVHGVSVDDIYEIYVWHDGNIGPKYPRAAVQVYEVFATECMTHYYDDSPCTATLGDQAVLSRKHVEKSISIKVLNSEETSSSATECFNELRSALEQQYSKGYASLTLLDNEDDSLPLFYITINSNGEYQFMDRKRMHIPNLPVCTTPSLVLDTAMRLGRYVRFLHLCNSPPCGDDQPYHVSLVPSSSFDKSNNVYVFPQGKNKYEICFESNSLSPLYLTILHFRPLWGIRQVYPTDGDWDEITFPSYDRVVRFSPSIPHELGNAQHSIDILKVLITNRPTSFRSQCQPDMKLGKNVVKLTYEKVVDQPTTQCDPEHQLLETLSGSALPSSAAVPRYAIALKFQEVVQGDSNITRWYTHEFVICNLQDATKGLQLPADFYSI